MKKYSSINAILQSLGGIDYVICDYQKSNYWFWPRLKEVSQHFRSLEDVTYLGILPMNQSDFVGGGNFPHHLENQTILVSSDFGSDDRSIMRHWEIAIKKWREQGCAVFAVAPHSEGILKSIATEASTFCYWEDSVTGGDEILQCANLLACLSVVQWASPALVTKWRQILGGSAMTEHLVWNHKDVWTEPRACGLKKNLSSYRDEFANFPTVLQDEILGYDMELRDKVSRMSRLSELLQRAVFDERIDCSEVYSSLETLIGSPLDRFIDSRLEVEERSSESLYNARVLKVAAEHIDDRYRARHPALALLMDELLKNQDLTKS